MKKIILTTWAMSFVCFAANAHATNYCGQTIPAGASITLDADQNCVSEGIRLSSSSALNGGGYKIYGYQLPLGKACVRAINTTGYVTLSGVHVEGCPEGVNFYNVKNPRLRDSRITGARGSAGVRCSLCRFGVISNTYIVSNAANGLLVQGGSEISVYNNDISGNGTGVRITAQSSNAASWIRLYNNWIVYNRGTSVIFDGSTHDSYVNNRVSPWWSDSVLFTPSTFSNFARGYNSCVDQAHRGQCQ